MNECLYLEMKRTGLLSVNQVKRILLSLHKLPAEARPCIVLCGDLQAQDSSFFCISDMLFHGNFQWGIEAQPAVFHWEDVSVLMRTGASFLICSILDFLQDTDGSKFRFLLQAGRLEPLVIRKDSVENEQDVLDFYQKLEEHGLYFQDAECTGFCMRPEDRYVTADGVIRRREGEGFVSCGNILTDRLLDAWQLRSE